MVRHCCLSDRPAAPQDVGAVHRRRKAGWVVAVAWLVSGCVRDAEPLVCDGMLEGDLVVTEIRGPQSGADSRGQWIELFNTSGRPIDIEGVVIDYKELDGGGTRGPILVRRSVIVDPGDYVVLGHHGPAPTDIPPFVDYSFFADWFSDDGGVPIVDVNGTVVDTLGGEAKTANLYANGGILNVEACGAVVDRFVYMQPLPDVGTLALDGSLEPSAEFNEEPAWCNDQVEPPSEGPQLYIGVPGTPGGPNPSCM